MLANGLFTGERLWYLEELADLCKNAVPNLEKCRRCGCIRSLRPEAVESLEVIERRRRIKEGILN